RQGQPGIDQLIITQPINSTLTIPVRADDADRDQIRLMGGGVDFNLNTFDASFETVEGPGVPGVGANLTLPLLCEFNLSERDSLRMQ
ncbi:hypothetical protein DF186_18750, partial [Enterococcus hirae]